MFKSWQELRDENEREEKHYFWDGTLDPRFTEGNFRPTTYDINVTKGKALDKFYEANRNNYWDKTDLFYAIVILGGFFLVVMLFGWYCSL